MPKLTKRNADSAKARETDYFIWDTELPGFGLRIHPTGRYHWFVRLRHRGKHRVTLGRTDELMRCSLARRRGGS